MRKLICFAAVLFLLGTCTVPSMAGDFTVSILDCPETVQAGEMLTMTVRILNPC